MSILSLGVKELAHLEAEKKEWQKHREIIKDAYKKERSEVRKLRKLLHERPEGIPSTDT